MSLFPFCIVSKRRNRERCYASDGNPSTHVHRHSPAYLRLKLARQAQRNEASRQPSQAWGPGTFSGITRRAIETPSLKRKKNPEERREVENSRSNQIQRYLQTQSHFNSESTWLNWSALRALVSY